ncbi:uncharacterized protein MONOS_2049 [Monocercomonoides exilis]|uniref:uncharacterized protein n=1 Tax=Monocercomonoides exilis TaxID=2049356 RepID=UPI003559B4C2|nr:hypothetical protein MONOS_2049 [Monocercomonoides exilis]
MFHIYTSMKFIVVLGLKLFLFHCLLQVVFSLYFDPSFYSPSFISFIVFFVIASVGTLLTLILGGIICFLIRREARISHILHSCSDNLGIVITHPLTCPFVTLLTKPLSCLLTSTRTENMTYCVDGAALPLSIIGIIMIFILVTFTTTYRFFVFDPQMKTPSINSSRKGIFFSVLQVTNVLATFICTLFQEWLPMVSSITQIILFGMLATLHIYYLPHTSLGGNMIFGLAYSVSSSCGVISLLMPVFDSLAAKSPALGIALFYLCWLVTGIVVGGCAVAVVKKRHMSMQLIDPIVEEVMNSSADRFLLSDRELDRSAAEQDYERRKKALKKVVTGFSVTFDEVTVEHRFSSQLTSSTASLPSYQPQFGMSMIPSQSTSPLPSSSMFSSSSTPSLITAYQNSSAPHHFTSQSNLASSSSVSSLASYSTFLANQNEIVDALLRKVKSPGQIWHSLEFLSNPAFNKEGVVVSFVNTFFIRALKKERFATSAELYISYALFLHNFLPSPQKMAIQLQKACELYPGWTSRWVIWTLTKELESQIGGRGYAGSGGGMPAGMIGGYGQLGEGSQSTTDSTMQLSSISNSRMQLAQAQKHYDLAKAHVFRMWSFLSRRVVDVNSVMRHAVKAVHFEKLADDVYMQTLEQNPSNPNVMRKLALLLRDVYADDETANHLLHEADVIEEETLMEDYVDTDESMTTEYEEMSTGTEQQGIGHGAKGMQKQMGGNVYGEMGKSAEEVWDDALAKEGGGNGAGSSGGGGNNYFQMRGKAKESRLQRNKAAKRGDKTRRMYGLKRPGNLTENILKKNNNNSMKVMMPMLLFGIVVVAGLFIGAYLQTTVRFNRALDSVVCERLAISMNRNFNHLVELATNNVAMVEMFDITQNLPMFEIVKENTVKAAKLMKDTAASQTQLYHQMEDSWVWKNKMSAWIVVEHDEVTETLTAFYSTKMNVLSLLSWISDVVLELVDLDMTSHESQEMFHTLSASLVVDIPMMVGEQLKEVMGLTYTRVVELQSTGTIILSIFMALSVIVLTMTTTIPLVVAINALTQKRKNVLRQLCNIPSDTASKILEKLEGKSETKTYSTRTSNSSVDETSIAEIEGDEISSKAFDRRGIRKKKSSKSVSSSVIPSVSPAINAVDNASNPLHVADPVSQPDESITPLMFQMMNTPQQKKEQIDHQTAENTIVAENTEAKFNGAEEKRKKKVKGRNHHTSRKDSNSDSSESDSESEGGGSQSSSGSSSDQSTSDSEDSERRARHKRRRKEKEQERREKQKRRKEEEIAAAQEEEKQQMIKQRAIDVDKKLHTLMGVIPASIWIRIIFGVSIIILSTSAFYVVSFVALSICAEYSSQLMLGEYRDIIIAQLSTFSTMLSAKQTYPTSNSSVVFTSPLLTSHIFSSTNYFTTVDQLRDTSSKLAQFLASLTRRYLLGSEEGGLTGDCVLDSVKASRTQGSNKELDRLSNEATKCLLINKTLCENRTSDDLGGVSLPFHGISELIERVTTAVNDLTRKKDEDLDFNLQSAVLIRQVIANDLTDGLTQIGEHFQLMTSEFSKLYSNTLLALFIVAIVLSLLFSLVFFVPLPGELQEITITTESIERLAKSKHIDTIEWSDELDTSVSRIDVAHRALVEALAGLISIVEKNEPVEKLQKQLDLLVSYTGTHFSDEELLMETYRYPWKLTSAHKAAHVGLVRKLLDFSDKLLRTRLPLSDVVMFCTTWVVSHIKTQDQELGMFLVQRGKPEHLSQIPNLDEFAVPPSVQEFFESDKVTMKELRIFEETVDRIRSNKTQSIS